MNSLIILPNECVDQASPDIVVAKLYGTRAQYAYSTHGIRQGQRIKVAILDGLRGDGVVTYASPDEISLELFLDEKGPLRLDLDIIVGVPRPQTIKKVVQATVMFGVRSLHFVRSERGEKSYLQSRSLEGEELQIEVIKALEQVWDPQAPEIRVHRSSERFFREVAPALLARHDEHMTRPTAIIAHPGGGELSSLPRERRGPLILAIGPERGWDEGEVSRFETMGFTRIGLGERILRVEIALVYLLGQLSV